MNVLLRKITGYFAVIFSLVLGIWFSTGLPRTFLLRDLSNTPGLLVYADETTVSDEFRKWTGFIESCPLPANTRNFLLQYCEAKTSKVVMRSLHPVITADEISKLKGMEIVNFLDLQTGDEADEVVQHLVKQAPNLRILHLQGKLTETGLRTICEGFPELEDLYLADAVIKEPVPELETCLLNLQGMTFSNCDLGRGFNESLENRPDVKIARDGIATVTPIVFD